MELYRIEINQQIHLFTMESLNIRLFFLGMEESESIPITA